MAQFLSFCIAQCERYYNKSNSTKGPGMKGGKVQLPDSSVHLTKVPSGPELTRDPRELIALVGNRNQVAKFLFLSRQAGPGSRS